MAVFPEAREGAWRYILLSLAVIAVGTLARVWFVASGQLDLVQDEAQYWDWSRHLQLSYYSKGPLIAWCNMLGTSLFGNTEQGVRAMAVFFSFGTQIVLLLFIGGLLRRPRTGFWTLFLLNTTPLFMASGVLMTTDSPLLFFWVSGLACLYWSQTGRGLRPWNAGLSLLVVCMALGVLAKYTMLAFAPLALVYGYLMQRKGLAPKGHVKRLALALGLGIVAGMVPIVWWNAINDWVGFRHVGALAGVAGSKPSPLVRFDRFPEYLGGQVGIILPWWLLYILWGGWQTLRGSKKPPQGPKADPQELFYDERWLLGLFFWPLWLFFLLWSLHTKIYPNWPAMSYATGAILGGFALARHLSYARGRTRKLARLWPALGILTFVLLHAQNWIPLPTAVDPTLRLKGWENMGAELGRLQKSAFDDPAQVFYFADTYDVTAALAFYAPDQPRAYCAYIDRRMNQYDLWPGPQDKKGWDALFVLKRFKDRLPAELEKMFASVDARHYQSTHGGKPARKFTIVLCRDFNGFWPEVESEVGKKAF